MRWWLLLSVVVLPAIADDRVSIVFDRITLSELVRLTYSEIAREPYVLTPEAIRADEQVSITLHDVDKRVAVGQVLALLQGAGFEVVKRAGVHWVRKSAPEAVTELVYQPRYRSVSYLVDAMAPLFPVGSFTMQRGIAGPSQGMSSGGVEHGPEAGQTRGAARPAARPVDSGTSAYSRIDREPPDVVVFRGSSRDIERLEKLVSQLDTVTPELLVKAVVFEVSTDDNEQSAFGLAVSVLGGKLGFNVGGVAGDATAVLRTTPLHVVVSALASDRRFRVVSSPQLRVKSGASAKLVVGSETPVLGAAQVDRNGNPVQSVEYKPAGVIFDLRPQVRQDVADLQISQQISNFIPTTTGVNNSPTLVKRELSTSVGVRDDETLVLGGLDEETSTSERSGVPWLPSLFDSTAKRRNRSEVLLILQATRI